MKTLEELGACREAIKAAGGHTMQECWEQCDRGDWLLWLAAKAGVKRQTVVIAACQCARTALQYVPEGKDRPLKAIETAEAWARGEANTVTVRTAATAAHAYAYATDTAADATAATADAAYAAAAAAHAATSPRAHAHAAATAADAAAYAAADAAATAAAAHAARTKTQKVHADTVRKHIAWADVEEALNAQ